MVGFAHSTGPSDAREGSTNSPRCIRTTYRTMSLVLVGHAYKSGTCTVGEIHRSGTLPICNDVRGNSSQLLLWNRTFFLVHPLFYDLQSVVVLCPLPFSMGSTVSTSCSTAQRSSQASHKQSTSTTSTMLREAAGFVVRVSQPHRMDRGCTGTAGCLRRVQLLVDPCPGWPSFVGVTADFDGHWGCICIASRPTRRDDATAFSSCRCDTSASRHVKEDREMHRRAYGRLEERTERNETPEDLLLAPVVHTDGADDGMPMRMDAICTSTYGETNTF